MLIADFVQELTESESNAGKDNRATKASRPYFVPCGTHLTQAQKEIANTMARNTQKDSHLLVKILNFTDTHPSRNCRLVRKHFLMVTVSKKLHCWKQDKLHNGK